MVRSLKFLFEFPEMDDAFMEASNDWFIICLIESELLKCIVDLHQIWLNYAHFTTEILTSDSLLFVICHGLGLSLNVVFVYLLHILIVFPKLLHSLTIFLYCHY